jgi:GTP1/Obg family GTP-binding protein
MAAASSPASGWRQKTWLKLCLSSILKTSINLHNSFVSRYLIFARYSSVPNEEEKTWRNYIGRFIQIIKEDRKE